MNINQFLKMVEEFFDIKHPNYIEDYIEENNESELWNICEDFFEQMRPQI